MGQYTTNTYEYGNISIVVHRPTLDEGKRMKQEAVLQRAISAYGKEMTRQKEREKWKRETDLTQY